MATFYTKVFFFVNGNINILNLKVHKCKSESLMLNNFTPRHVACRINCFQCKCWFLITYVDVEHHTFDHCLKKVKE